MKIFESANLVEIKINQALQKGIEAHRAGNFNDADRYYTAILNSKPLHAKANHNMGALALDVGKANEAIPFLKTALEVNPNIEQFWLSYLEALIITERTLDARILYDKAKQIGLKSNSFIRLEQLLFLAENTSKSSTTKKDRIYNSKDNIVIEFTEPLQFQQEELINLLKDGNTQEADETAKQLLTKFPNSAFIHNILGSTRASLGLINEAIEAYEKAISINPNYAEAFNNKGNILKDQLRLDEAVIAYEKAISINPNYADAYYNIGNALQDQNKLEEAVKAYERAVALVPNYAESYNNMGNAHRKQGNLDKAIAAFQKALSVGPQIAEVFYNLGIAFQEQSKFEDAIDAYKTALKINPDFQDASSEMGRCLLKSGKHEQGRSLIQEADGSISL